MEFGPGGLLRFPRSLPAELLLGLPPGPITVRWGPLA